MVLKTEGNTYATLAASPSPLRGKPTLAQDVASSLVDESEEDALSYSPIKVLALTFQGYIGRTYLAIDALHCFYFVALPLA